METPHNKKNTEKFWTRPKGQDSDGAYGRLFRNRHIFLQLLKSFVDLDFVRELRPQDLELADSRHYLPELKRRESDVIWKITGRSATGRKAGQWYIYILLENQSTPDKTILLRSFLYILSLYDTLWRQSSNGLLPNVLPVILYNGKDDWNLPSNLRELIESRLPAPWIQSFQCFVIVEKDVPKEYRGRLHNLVAVVFLLERQQDEEGLALAIMKVIDYLKVEDKPAIRDLMVWITKLFVDGIEPEAVKRLRTLEGAKTMLSELAKKVNQNAIKAAKADMAYLEGKLDTAKAMLKDGVPLQTVIRYTGLTEDQLAREMKKDSGV